MAKVKISATLDPVVYNYFVNIAQKLRWFHRHKPNVSKVINYMGKMKLDEEELFKFLTKEKAAEFNFFKARLDEIRQEKVEAQKLSSSAVIIKNT